MASIVVRMLGDPELRAASAPEEVLIASAIEAWSLQIIDKLDHVSERGCR